MQITSKFPDMGTTIFTVMSKMANDFKAINLAQGFPNFPVDEKLISILQHTAKENAHQYCPMAGLPGLLDQIAHLTESKYGRKVSPGNEILVSAGATQAIFTTIQALVFAGEEVLVLDPSYDCYVSPIELVGAKAVRIPLGDDFMPDWQRIRENCSDKTKMIITNNPHNPSGTIWKPQDFIELEGLLDDFPQLIHLSDEVYEHIAFETFHRSVNHFPAIYERSVVVSSFGKTFHITGWKIGYLLAPEKLLNEIKKVHQFLVFCVNSVAQHTLANYLPQVDVHLLAQFYQEKRDRFSALMRDSRFELLPCEGTYFQLASYAEISDMDDISFTKELVQKGVATIPLSVFNADNADRKLIRFCFAKTDETLNQAADILCKI